MHVEPSSVRKVVPGLSIPPLYKYVYPQLECKSCGEVGVYPILSLGEGKYYKKCLEDNYWWHNDTIRTFCTLLYHEQHNPEVWYVDCTLPSS